MGNLKASGREIMNIELCDQCGEMLRADSRFYSELNMPPGVTIRNLCCGEVELAFHLHIRPPKLSLLTH